MSGYSVELARPAALAGLLATTVLLGACATEEQPRPAERMVNLGFEDVAAEDPAHLKQLGGRLDQVQATAVSIAVGRTDWTAFPWEAHPESASAEVKRTGRDFVAESIAALQQPGPLQQSGPLHQSGSLDQSGTAQKRDVILTIDVLLDKAITADPSLAGRNPVGKASGSFASLSSLRTGVAGTRLAELAAAVAKRYRPTAVNLTELMFDEYTFGPDDLQDFTSAMHRSDWPRRADGTIDTAAAEVTAWRTHAMADIVRKVRSAVEPFGVDLDMDVRSPSVSASADRADSGQNYDLLLEQLDRIHVWEYVGLNNERSPGTEELVKALRQRAGTRYSLSIGLWSGDGSISPDELERTLRLAADGGAASVSVTPASLMGDGHWDALRRAWAR
ncbi:hypothetical protein OOZ51_17865 [Arthrobacter sp. MI7-26]|uniref:hypothetical protein n=1 Tax=Arthrobacter sp. MI7-26 TaxID=2993653 RepID=UPI002249808E|nr:hypothetical protein [Arthrobacter sp. MI7-26]MCX2749661.1 hypothetical protein [Arthrobacter sp. MI7-26]